MLKKRISFRCSTELPLFLKCSVLGRSSEAQPALIGQLTYAWLSTANNNTKETLL